MEHFEDSRLQGLLDIREAMAALSAAFEELARGQAVVQPRMRIESGGTMFNTMAAMLPGSGYCGAKVYTYTSAGYGFVVLLFSMRSGKPLATFDAGYLTTLRTSAASALASTYLARQDARILAVFGSGPQAAAHVSALTAVLPITEVHVIARSNGVEFASRLAAQTGLNVVMSDAESAVRAADVIVTATRSKDPLFPGDWIRAGCFLSAVGSSRAGHSEFDSTAISRCDRIVVELRSHARHEAGNLIKAAEAGVLDWNRVADLGELVTGAACGRQTVGEITLFDSAGIALEDIAVAAAAYRKLRGESVD